MIPTIPAIVPASDLRKNFDSILDRAAREPVYLIRKNQCVAVLVPVRIWEHIQAEDKRLKERIAALDEELTQLAGQAAALESEAEGGPGKSTRDINAA
jgi:prevent-host-death family protein